jgi:preprotein translocase YajC subunit
VGLAWSLVNAILLAAPSGDSPPAGDNPIFTLVFFGAIFAAMYFLLLRPQRRRLKESQLLQKSITVGDEVVMNSGIYGFVSGVEDDILWVDIADGHGSERIEVRVSRGSIARKVAAVAATDDTN